MKWVIWVLLVVPFVSAVTIHGTVYDFGLDEVSNAIVEINTTPQQKLVAKNGLFSFDVAPGKYVLTAVAGDDSVEENISAVVDGSYVVDLILLPGFGEDFSEDIPDVGEIEGIVEDRPASHWFWWAVVFTALGIFVYFSAKPKKKKQAHHAEKEVKAVSDELHKILELLDKEGGRITQKELRKQLPHSEAKVSLMIDELEQKGVVKRIKKGRGNIIVRV